MKVTILAGGLGTRLSEHTRLRPKALVPIGGQPILWHLMQYFRAAGFHEFIIALGYKGGAIRRYFRGLSLRRTASLGPGHVRLEGDDDSLVVELVDTGEHTENGGRIKRLAPYLEGSSFMLTWCDGLADVDLHRLLAFHRSHGRLATLTAIHPPPRFGRLQLNGTRVLSFHEKTIHEDEWVNGAFFVLEPRVFEYIDGDDTQFERESLTALARDDQLAAYRHESFWQCMDTLQEARHLNALWEQGHAPWKVWS